MSVGALPALPARDEARRLRRTLLSWFREHRRALPFRGSRDPWRIWVSEVMLQQTRVEAMRVRYPAFLARFPDPAALAAAAEDDVVAAWSGLGYYGRARALHRAARALAESGGGIPESADGLGRLPGVGPYTAAAVASIAFDEPVAAVDGNVRRVLARLFALRGTPGRKAFEDPLREAAARLMAADGARSPGDWNQALMELGALVCTPAAPRCGACPLADACRGRAAGLQQELPQRPRRLAPVSVRWAQAVIRDGQGRLLLFRRRESPLRGLYEMPGGECRGGEPPRDAVVREAARRYGLRLSAGRAFPSFPHAVMHWRIEVFPFGARPRGPLPAPGSGGARFVAPAEVGRLPASSIVGKLLTRLGAPADGSAGEKESGLSG